MCVNYIHYFPKVDLEVCKSSVTTKSLFDFFRFMNEYASLLLDAECYEPVLPQHASYSLASLSSLTWIVII